TPLQATAYGNSCPQSARLGSPSLNEDCLYLNVWAPAGGGHPKPVMVFIHGGSFNAGNGGAVPGTGPDYSGADIAERADVVVVTINYRLSILGYLTAPALDAENPQHVSGNYGLQDQQAALAWVKRNIARFGGDPANVTLFGESAGGISVLYQLVSPGAADLFQRAIVESSNDGASLPLSAAEPLEAPVIAALGCGGASDVAACLRALPVATIINSGLTVGPPIDGYTVPQQPPAAFAAGQFNHVPTIIGTNANEGTYFLAVATQAAGRTLTAADYAAVIVANYPNAVSQIEAAYPLASYDTPADALAAIETDSFFACPSDAVRTALAPQVPVWGYEFAEPNPVQNFPLPVAPGVDLRDSHTTELAYVFGHDGSGNPLTGQDRRLSDAVIGYWTRLAASGNPNFALRLAALRELDDLPALWLRYEGSQPFVLSLRTPVGEASGFAAAHQCALWKSLGYPEELLLSVPKS
ncbi:MAG: carboxylesterase family protein, partial [Acetobacteraceae bacterium]|nr:carboxylesterase family protein [Acetobacteraceae bacterium]